MENITPTPAAIQLFVWEMPYEGGRIMLDAVEDRAIAQSVRLGLTLQEAVDKNTTTNWLAVYTDAEKRCFEAWLKEHPTKIVELKPGQWYASDMELTPGQYEAPSLFTDAIFNCTYHVIPKTKGLNPLWLGVGIGAALLGVLTLGMATRET